MGYGIPDRPAESEVASASVGSSSSRTQDLSITSWIEAGRRLESVASSLPNPHSGVTLIFWAGILLGFVVGVLV